MRAKKKCGDEKEKGKHNMSGVAGTYGHVHTCLERLLICFDSKSKSSEVGQHDPRRKRSRVLEIEAESVHVNGVRMDQKERRRDAPTYR